MTGRLRAIAAAVAGVIAWPVVATVGNLVLRVDLDGYREAEAGMAFSSSMMVGRPDVGLVAAIASGVVAQIAAGCVPPRAHWAVVAISSDLPLVLSGVAGGHATARCPRYRPH